MLGVERTVSSITSALNSRNTEKKCI
jgi:hypothetical protein